MTTCSCTSVGNCNCTPGQCNCKSCHNGADKNAQASSSACSCVAKDSEGYVREASSYPPRERRLTSRPLFAHCSPLRPSPLCLRLRYLPSASVVRCNGIAVHQSSVTSCSCTSKADCKCGDSCTCASCGKDSKKDSTGCACSYVPVSPNRSETMFASQEADGGIYVLQGEVQVHDQLCLRRRLQVHQLPFEEGALTCIRNDKSDPGVDPALPKASRDAFANPLGRARRASCPSSNPLKRLRLRYDALATSRHSLPLQAERRRALDRRAAPSHLDCQGLAPDDDTLEYESRAGTRIDAGL
ncbi:hypothetical protein C6P46_004242 [Rhodotorula mucilaginosa]|uniref:Metallothionein n=1 Tax=Rhodotorula mucilaginosa TaxID=5537 RepID=A0A9P7B9N4_RHOMI|nr:hypothetical protein C6P46_004242 [Rhodotorula mucilaginosa]